MIVHGLADAFVSGPWELEGLVDRGGRVLGRRYRWLRPLARRVLAEFPAGPRPRLARLAGFIARDEGFQRAVQSRPLELHFAQWPRRAMAPAPGAPESWRVPAITSEAALAEFLGLEPNELDWLADIQSRERSAVVEPLRHYRYRCVRKRSGSTRLIEAPKRRLRQLQRLLLDQILARIPPHEAAHGFRPGRSVASFVGPHVGRAVVLKMDLRDFFVSITSARVTAIYLTAGYPEPVARLLTGLCTNTAPPWVWNTIDPADAYCASTPASWSSRRRYQQPHLPQGAPTSPALANLAAYRLDARLAGLTKAALGTYSRYADDLLFSGDEDFARVSSRLRATVAAIALEEGFAVQHRKTRLMRQGTRQCAAGVIINQKLNIPRREYDELKAILCNCARRGPEGQNRSGASDFRAHLAGRIAHVAQLHRERGERLRRLFDQIAW